MKYELAADQRSETADSGSAEDSSETADSDSAEDSVAHVDGEAVHADSVAEAGDDEHDAEVRDY